MNEERIVWTPRIDTFPEGVFCNIHTVWSFVSPDIDWSVPDAVHDNPNQSENKNT